MNKVFTALVALATVAAFAPASAEDDCQMTTSSPEVDAAGIAYVDNDEVPLGGYSIWVYQESNGIEGLQRGDEVVDDTCGGEAGFSDTIIF